MQGHRPKKLLDQAIACPASPERSPGELAAGIRSGSGSVPRALRRPTARANAAPRSRGLRRLHSTYGQLVKGIFVGHWVLAKAFQLNANCALVLTVQV